MTAEPAFAEGRGGRRIAAASKWSLARQWCRSQAWFNLTQFKSHRANSAGSLVYKLCLQQQL